MKIEPTFEKKIRRLNLYTLFLTPVIIIALVIKKYAVFFIELAIFSGIVSLLYFSYLCLRFRQTINRNQYFLFILAISVGMSIYLAGGKGNFFLTFIIGMLLIFYGTYKINPDTKKGKEIFAKRVAYLSIAVALGLLIIFLVVILKYLGVKI